MGVAVIDDLPFHQPDFIFNHSMQIENTKLPAFALCYAIFRHITCKAIKVLYGTKVEKARLSWEMLLNNLGSTK